MTRVSFLVRSVMFLALVVGGAMYMPQSAAATDSRAAIAAIVNDDIITTWDVDTRLRLNTGGRPIPQAERARANSIVLDELINEALQRQEADKLSIDVERSEIEQAFASIAAKNNLSADAFRGELRKMGVPYESFYEKLETDIAWGQVVRRRLRPQVNISETDIDAVLDDRIRNDGKIQYRVAEIFAATNLVDGSDDAEKKMDQLMAQLQNGAPFPEIARRYSEAAGASRGGDLGWLYLDQMDPAFQEAILQLKPGQVAPNVKTARGLHILLLIDKREQKAFEEIEPTPAAAAAKPADVPLQYQLQQIFLASDTTEPQALRAAKIERIKDLRAEVQGCDAMKSIFEDFPSDMTGDLGFVAANDLPKPVQMILADLPIGQLSTPVANSRGVFALMVCDKKGGGEGASEPVEAQPQVSQVDPEAARDKVANTLGMKRLEELQQRYVRDLRAAAFIDRRI